MTFISFKKIMNFIKYKLDKIDKQTRLNAASIGLQKKNLLMNNFKTRTTNGVTATSNSDGSITLDGTSTSSESFILCWNLQTGVSNTSQYANNKKWIPNGEYIVSGGIPGKASVQVRLATEPNSEGELYSSQGSETLFTVKEKHLYVYNRILILGKASFNNETIYPMVRPVNTDSTWETFVPDLQYQITKYEEQTLIDTGLRRINFLKNGCKDKTSVGVDFTVDNNGIITLNGKHTNNQVSVIYWNMANGSTIKEGQFIDNERNFPAGTYILSGGVEGAAVQVCVATDESRFESASNTPRATVYQDEAVVIITEEENYVWFRLRILSNTAFENVKIYPMLRPVEIKDNTYKPYKPSLQEQIEDLRKQVAMLSSEN